MSKLIVLRSPTPAPYDQISVDPNVVASVRGAKPRNGEPTCVVVLDVDYASAPGEEACSQSLHAVGTVEEITEFVNRHRDA